MFILSFASYWISFILHIVVQSYVWLLLLVGWLLPNLLMVISYTSIIRANRSASSGQTDQHQDQ
jgi:predicted DCC family thiol-disulfide oxidoreductase YuxK